MTRVAVNPDLLHWAIGRVGLFADALSHTFPKLEARLRGDLSTTLKQLERLPGRPMRRSTIASCRNHRSRRCPFQALVSCLMPAWRSGQQVFRQRAGVQHPGRLYPF